MKLFQKTAIAILAFFMGLMIYVTIIAHTRRSGITGIDTARIQQMRYNELGARNQEPGARSLR
jgi:hypothetical protein